MAKPVQLVLTKDVRKLGKMGDLVQVAPGYARNYLVPQGIGMHVNPGILKQVERRKELERQRLAELKVGAEAQAAAIAAVGKLSIAKQAGDKDAIFGTVTNQDLADALKSLANVEVDKRDISVPDIKRLGEYTATIELHPEVSVNLEFEVVAA
jgi:large subunit ribosomal protein L9